MTNRYFEVRGKCIWTSAMVILSVWWLGIGIALGSGDAEKGKGLFREGCQHCHGLTGKGDGEMASYLTPPPSNLRSESTQAKSNNELKTIIMNGREGTAMAGFNGVFDESQLSNLLAYIRSLRPEDSEE